MLYDSGPVTKKMFKEILIKHHPGDRLNDLISGEFFNEAFKRSSLISREPLTRKKLSPLLTG